MPPKLCRMSGEEAISVLKRLGFMVIRQRGSHIILKKRDTLEEVTCVVPLQHELAIGTLRSVLRQARITPEEFMNNI